jgi:3',5'-cyclic AMP phosphodiesterase CpdA
LDTRTHRDVHCIPSWAALKIPMLGSIGGTITALFACITRWLTAKILLHPWLRPAFSSFCQDGQVLGDEQWAWLEGVLSQYPDAAAHIVVSSIQVLTTNPAPESWGHFDAERTRLLRLLKDLPGLVLLSGDVHHAEIASSHPTTKKGDWEIVEVTSSGLTHSVQDMGSVVAPLALRQMKEFSAHRRRRHQPDDGHDYKATYVGKNYGTIKFDWKDDTSSISSSSHSTMMVNVHNEQGDQVLSSGRLTVGTRSKSKQVNQGQHDVNSILKITEPDGDGSLSSFMSNLCPIAAFVACIALLVVFLLFIINTLRGHSKFNEKRKKSKQG